MDLKDGLVDGLVVVWSRHLCVAAPFFTPRSYALSHTFHPPQPSAHIPSQLIRDVRDSTKEGATTGTAGGSSSRKSSSSSSSAASSSASSSSKSAAALPPLLEALVTRMEDCRDLLNGLFEKIRPLAKQAETVLHSNSASVNAGASAGAGVGGDAGDVSETVLTALRLLPVVTREERAAVFLQATSSFLPPPPSPLLFPSPPLFPFPPPLPPPSPLLPYLRPYSPLSRFLVNIPPLKKEILYDVLCCVVFLLH